MRARGSKALRVLGIILVVVALKGLVGLIEGTTNGLNLGIFLCPGILAAVFLWVSRPEKKKED